MKLTKEHPTFQRVSKGIHDSIEKLRPATIALAQRKVIAGNPLALMDSKILISQVAEEVTRIELSLYKRQARRMGVLGKYVGH